MNNKNKTNGCLWLKTSAKGVKYLTGKLIIENTPYRITIFTNNRKQNERQPDYNIVIENMKGGINA